MMVVALFALLLTAAVWLSFTIGRVTADRSVNLNHHKMMMLLMDLRGRDDMVPIMPSSARTKLDRLLIDYERLELEDAKDDRILSVVRDK